jgi:hypothetical protein
MAIKHKFVSGKTDDADATLVQSSDWNDDHLYDYVLTMGAYNVITNIGTTYDAVNMSRGLGIAVVDMTDLDTIEFRVLYNKITANNFFFQLWNETDGAQVGTEITDTGAINAAKLVSAQFTGIALTGIKVLRIRMRGATAADDPVYYGGALMLRNTG